MLTRLSTERAKVLDKNRRVIRHIGTNEMPDSYNSILRDDGWKNIDAYLKKNPVVFWAHETRTMPIGRTIGIVPTTIKGRDLRGREAVFKARYFDVEYPDRKTYPYGHQVYKMFRDGFLRGTSVGFDPHEGGVERVTDEAALERLGLKPNSTGEIFRAMDLREYSAAPIPGNSEALTEQLSGFAKELRLETFVRVFDATDPKFAEAFAETMAALKAEVDRAGGGAMIREGNASNGAVTVEIDDKGDAKVVKREIPDSVPLLTDTDTKATHNDDLVLSDTSLKSLEEMFREEADEEHDEADPAIEVEVHRETVRLEDGTDEVRVIKKVGGKFCVFSEDGTKKLGCHPTKDEAVKQLQAIEISKHAKMAKTIEELRALLKDAKDGDVIDASAIGAKGLNGLFINRGVKVLLSGDEPASAERGDLVADAGDASRTKANFHDSMARDSRNQANSHGLGTMKGDHRLEEAKAHEELAQLHKDHGTALDKHADSSDPVDRKAAQELQHKITTKEQSLSGNKSPYAYAGKGAEAARVARATLVEQTATDADPDEEQNEADTWADCLEALKALDAAMVAHAQAMGEPEPDDGSTPDPDDNGVVLDKSAQKKKPPAPVAAKGAPDAKAIRAELKRFFLDLNLPSRNDLDRLEAEMNDLRDTFENGRGRRVGGDPARGAPPPRAAIELLAESSLASLRRTADAMDEIRK